MPLSRQAAEQREVACLRANNLRNGRAFSFETGGPIAGEFEVGDAASMAALEARVGERVRHVAAREGIGAVGRAFVGEVLGPSAWASFPEPARHMLTDNGPAILAEHHGEPPAIDRSSLAAIEAPALVVSAADLNEVFSEIVDTLVAAMPDARAARIAGGHLVSRPIPP